MAKRVNYGFQKRQKEIKRQQKQAEKAERKRLKKEPTDGADRSGTMPVADDFSESVRDAPTGSRESIDERA